MQGQSIPLPAAQKEQGVKGEAKLLMIVWKRENNTNYKKIPAHFGEGRGPEETHNPRPCRRQK